MKTTIEIPDSLFRRAKSRAAETGLTLKQFFTEAIQDKLATNHSKTTASEPDWMQGFGTLRHLRRETRRIQKAIDEDLNVVEPEDHL